MSRHKEKKRNALAFASDNALIILIIILLFVYFVYHTINGERGVLVAFRLSHDLQEQSRKLEKITQERMVLDKRVKSLNSASLDLDLLDEIARKNLGLIGKDEFVLYRQNKP
jgi:cell division protein FtsB